MDSPLIQELSNLYTHSVNQENNSDEALCEYFFGVKRGKESVLDEQVLLKHSTLSSELSLIMFAAWPYIEDSISNRRQMYDFFVKRLGKQRVGDFKRVEKFLQRIGFSPAQPDVLLLTDVPKPRLAPLDLALGAYLKIVAY